MSDIFNGVEAGSVVRVKFKSIPEITKKKNMTNIIRELDEWDIGTNINALVLGGDFIVVNVEGAKNSKDPVIEIDNHHDGGSFPIFPDIIESIEVVDVANKFASEEHGIIMIQVDDKIYINGILLEDNKEAYNEADRDKMSRFVNFMEKFVVATAFEASLDEEQK